MDICIEMCIDMRTDSCIDMIDQPDRVVAGLNIDIMHIDMCMDKREDMHIDMRMDMCADMCTDMRTDSIQRCVWICL